MKRLRKKGFLLIALIALACLVVAWCCSACVLTTTEYELQAQAIQDIRILQLSDLHGAQFGEDNGKLIDAVRKQNPDIIAMTGDMFSADADDAQVDLVCALIRDLSEFAPVYYALGNHELAYMQSNGEAVLEKIRDAGAVILDKEYADISVNGQPLRIGGCYGYLLTRKYRNGPEQDFMDDFVQTENPKVLLAHMGEGLLEYNCLNGWDVDLVLSGHAHGGQICLPLIGGLYDPEVGWLPKYEKGIFRFGESTAVVSAGLGSSTQIPRFGNPPETVLVTLQADSAAADNK